MTLEYRVDCSGKVATVMTACPLCGAELPDSVGFEDHWQTGDCTGQVEWDSERNHESQKADRNVSIGHVWTTDRGFVHVGNSY
jgi:hypothetical protein